VLGEQAVPFGCCGTEDDYRVLALLRSLYVSRYMLRTTAVSSHARCSHRVVCFEAALLNELLRENIAGGKEDLGKYYQRLFLVNHVLCPFRPAMSRGEDVVAGLYLRRARNGEVASLLSNR
jgi:hypothetical protein